MGGQLIQCKSCHFEKDMDVRVTYMHNDIELLPTRIHPKETAPCLAIVHIRLTSLMIDQQWLHKMNLDHYLSLFQLTGGLCGYTQSDN